MVSWRSFLETGGAWADADSQRERYAAFIALELQRVFLFLRKPSKETLRIGSEDAIVGNLLSVQDSLGHRPYRSEQTPVVGPEGTAVLKHRGVTVCETFCCLEGESPLRRPGCRSWPPRCWRGG